MKPIHEKYPDVELLINLNPTESVDLNWGTPKFTYEEYLEAQKTYIAVLFKDELAPESCISCRDKERLRV